MQLNKDLRTERVSVSVAMSCFRLGLSACHADNFCCCSWRKGLLQLDSFSLQICMQSQVDLLK